MATAAVDDGATLTTVPLKDIAPRAVSSKKLSKQMMMLPILLMNIIMCMQLTLSLTPINIVASQYYHVSSTTIDWLSNMPVLSYVFLSIPISYIARRSQSRSLLIFCAFCDVAATLVNYAGQLYSSDEIIFLFIGQSFTCLAYSCLLQLPERVAVFPEEESLWSTTKKFMPFHVGIVVGFFHPLLTVQSGNLTQDKLRMFLMIQLVEAGIIFILTCCYYEKPLERPILASIKENPKFQDDSEFPIKKDRCTILLAIYVIISSIGVIIFGVLNHILEYFSTEMVLIVCVAYMGTNLALVSLTGVEKESEKNSIYKAALFLLNISLFLWIVLLSLAIREESLRKFFGVNMVLGAVTQPFTISYAKQSIKWIKPTTNETLTMAMTLVFNVFNCVGIFVLCALIRAGYVKTIVYVIAGLFFISSLLSMVVTNKSKSWNDEEKDII